MVAKLRFYCGFVFEIQGFGVETTYLELYELSSRFAGAILQL